MNTKPHDPVATIPEAITRNATATPDHPAVVMNGVSLTYEQLDKRSNAVARTLEEYGVVRGDRVGLFAHKSIELIVAMYGVMKAGAAYVPINPDAPLAYVADLLTGCEITHLVSGKTKRSVVMQLADQVNLAVCLGVVASDADPVPCVDWEAVWSRNDSQLDVDLTGDDLAYIIFTSGSTGRPKGIMHSHRTALAYATVSSTTFGFRSADRITNHAPLNFDLSTLELFGGAVAGSTVVVVSEAHARLPASFSQLLQDERVTVVNAVPFALVQLLHRGALDDRDLSSLRWVLFGGEVYPTKDLRALMRRLPQARFGNVYGPAEVNGCTYEIVPDLPPDMTEPISIGRLYPGMEALVVDDEDRPVAPGDTGEILIRSDAHMLGYWRQPELTEQRRFRRARSDGGEDVFYRTGDLVQENADGSFRLIGRKDRQIKSRGHRVELDEVETALVSHAAVEQAVVYAVPDGEGSHDIEASVVIVNDATDQPTPADLRGHALRAIPRYAVPRVIRIVESVPRTSTGKPDRVALVQQALRRVGV